MLRREDLIDIPLQLRKPLEESPIKDEQPAKEKDLEQRGQSDSAKAEEKMSGN